MPLKLHVLFEKMILLQVFQNIHKIKLCMEVGRTVVLLNLENLYEILYDVLNQVSN